MRKRKWLDGEFETPEAKKIKPIRATRNGPVRSLTGDAELKAALNKVLAELDQKPAKREQMETALAELRGTINFYRAHHSLDAQRMGRIANEKNSMLDVKYTALSVREARQRDKVLRQETIQRPVRTNPLSATISSRKWSGFF